MATILVVSDNHGSLNSIKQILQQKNYFAVLHAGDYTCDPIEVLHLHSKIYFTLGNNDDFADRHEMSLEGKYHSTDNAYVINLLGIRFIIIHGHHCLGWNKEKSYYAMVQLAQKHKSDFLIYGHTHSPFYDVINGIHILNPGSINYPRSSAGKTYAEIKIEDQKIINVKFKKHF